MLAALLEVIQTKWPSAFLDGMAVVVPYGKGDEVTSMEVVPAFKRTAGGYVIPEPSAGTWLATNPKTHHELSTAKNSDCEERYVPFVKMIKAINRELDEVVSPSFLLEVMAMDLVKTPFGRYQDEIIWFLATAADQLDRAWPDPAGLGGDVNTSMTATQRCTAINALRGAQAIAERANDLEDDGQERAAVEEWRRLFGTRMPRP